MGMSRYLYTGIIVILVIAGGLYLAGLRGTAGQAGDYGYWGPAGKMLGTKTETNPDGSATFDVPRNLTATLDGIRLAPGSDLSHEIRMQKTGDKTLAVGELVLTRDEIADVTRKLRDAGIDETALHNHLLHESPQLMYLHFRAYGDPVNITTAISNIIAPMGRAPDVEFDDRGMDTVALDTIMGTQGKADRGVYAFTFPRKDSVTMNGVTLSPYMDISSDVSFQPLGKGKALAIGELVLESGEVEPVIRSLSSGSYEIDALHSHMLTEQPRLFYLHCRATGDAGTLAREIREALDRTKSLTR